MLLLVFPCVATAGDRACQKRADVVFDMVAARHAIKTTLEKEPVDGPTGEPWRYQLFLHGKALTKSGASAQKQEEIAKSVMEVSFSENPEIETDIFTEYYFLTCRGEKDGVAYVPLKEVSKEAMLYCWNTVGSRKEFQACVEPAIRAKE